MVGQTSTQSKQEVVVAGIDPSLQGTGVCVWSPSRKGVLELVRFPKLRGTHRLIAIRAYVVELLQGFNVHLVAFEGYSYNSVGRWFDLGELGGVLKVELTLRNIPTLIVPPASLKKFVSGNGQADKKRMIREVNQHYLDEPVSDDNLADAAGLAHFAYVAYTGESTRRCELEAVKKLKTETKKIPKVFKKLWADI